MKPISRRLATGTIGSIIFLVYFTLYLITDSDILISIHVFIIFIVFCISISSIIGNILSRNYNEEENDDKIFYIIGAVSIVLLICLMYFYIKRHNG